MDIPRIPGYDLRDEIGRGGFGVVYRARQTALGRQVAVKVLTRTHLNEHELVRFDRECRALGMVGDHPNIVSVHDCGQTDEGQPYLVMGFEAGGSLRERLDRDGPLPWREAAALMAAVTDALHRAHRAGVLHRDVKPANILMSHYGGAKLADFGIARVTGMRQTTAGAVTASIAHAAPELLDGSEVTVASDIYAVGSTLVTLLAGRPPFGGEEQGILRLIARIGSESPPPLDVLGLPAVLQDLIMRMLAKDPAMRPTSAEAVAAELRGISELSDLSTQRAAPPSAEARRQDVDAPLPPPPARSRTAVAGDDVAVRPRRPLVRIGASLLAGLALLGAGFMMGGALDTAPGTASPVAADVVADVDVVPDLAAAAADEPAVEAPTTAVQQVDGGRGGGDRR